MTSWTITEQVSTCRTAYQVHRHCVFGAFASVVTYADLAIIKTSQYLLCGLQRRTGVQLS